MNAFRLNARISHSRRFFVIVVTRGYDAAEDKIVNMFDAGIIDPLKVVRTGLTDAR